MPDNLFSFQMSLVEWACRKGRAAIFADCGLGKGQPENSLVLTPTGWRAIGNLVVGDKVIASDGKSANVTGIYHKPIQNTYRIHFSDGCSFVVDDDHLHICRTNNDKQRDKSWRIMSTAELRRCGNIRYGKNGKSRNYDIPIVGDVVFESSPLAIKPYLLGVLLGDGYLNGNVSMSSADDELLDRARAELPEGVWLKHKSRYDWRIMTGNTGNQKHPFRQALKDLGLLGLLSDQKFVPREYLFASISDRLDLLRGLMDTDGYIMQCGTCQFYSTSESLANAVVHLVRSLGGIPTRSSKQTSCNGKQGKPCHMVTFSLARHNPFYLGRKAMRWNPSPRDNGRWIDRIEFEAKQKTICISADSPDQSYVTENFIVTHNTPMQLTWAENVVRKTDGRVLILTPLAVAFQTVKEGEKFGIEVKHRREELQNGDRIVVTNYERLHYFNPNDFDGVVCDESSILKNFDGETRKAITDFMRKRPYRLLCTATAAPNDYVELGTSSEALGVMERKHMLAQFFTHDGGDTATWRLKGYARERLFWRWVCSWARACRKPSDLGFEDNGFKLPSLTVRDHIVTAAKPRDGYLFDLPAVGLAEQRSDLRRTIGERCDMAAQLVNATEGPSLCWCNLNEEGVRLNKLIPNSVEVAGHHSDEFKEDAIRWFSGEMCNCVLTTKHPHVRLQPCTHGKDGCKCERQKKTKSTCEITTALIAANTNEQESNKTNTTRGDATGILPTRRFAKNARRNPESETLQQSVTEGCALITESECLSTMRCAKSRAGDVLFAGEQQATSGIGGLPSITATEPEKYEDCFVQTAIKGSGSLPTMQKDCCEHPNTSKRTLISKPTIFGLGVNLQHCAHETFFPSHSYEQYYQCVRRCWRFGQKNPVTVDMVTTDGQQNVLRNMERKAEAASEMFAQLVALMRDELQIKKTTGYTKREEIPSWL